MFQLLVFRYRLAVLICVVSALALSTWFATSLVSWSVNIETVKAAPGDSNVLVGELDRAFTFDTFYKTDLFMWNEADKVWNVYPQDPDGISRPGAALGVLMGPLTSAT